MILTMAQQGLICEPVVLPELGLAQLCLKQRVWELGAELSCQNDS